MHRPLDSYWFVIKQILCYLKHLVSTGLLITKAMDFILQAYSDSNWATDRGDRRSMNVYCIHMISNLSSEVADGSLW